jgi:hypothetical protein
MNKERELLRRISSHSGTRMDTHFIYAIRDLLAQPEHTERWSDLNHFAAFAMQGLIVSPTMGDPDIHESAKDWIKDITETAYEFADAMLKARACGLDVD